mgnify:CR=1 FL=1
MGQLVSFYDWEETPKTVSVYDFRAFLLENGIETEKVYNALILKDRVIVDTYPDTFSEVRNKLLGRKWSGRRIVIE